MSENDEHENDEHNGYIHVPMADGSSIMFSTEPPEDLPPGVEVVKMSKAEALKQIEDALKEGGRPEFGGAFQPPESVDITYAPCSDPHCPNPHGGEVPFFTMVEGPIAARGSDGDDYILLMFEGYQKGRPGLMPVAMRPETWRAFLHHLSHSSVGGSRRDRREQQRRGRRR